jgi:diguanylate cyclase (GGDEF)-like protein
MREYVGIAFLTNLVSMLRADIDGAVLLADDEEEARFYERCVHNTARVVATPNAATPLLRALDERGIEGVVAAISRPKLARGDEDSVFQPSLGDVASLLLTSGGFQQAIADVCGGPWLSACEKQVGPVLDRAVWIARVLGRVRLACAVGNEASLEPDSLLKLIRWDSFEPAWGLLGAELPGGSGSSDEIRALRATPCGGNIKVGILECNGRDVASVLAAATKLFRPRGIKAIREITAPDLIAMMRVSFDLRELEADEMFWQMRRWERRNPGYRLLREWRTLDPLGILWDQRYWDRDLRLMLQFLGPVETLSTFKMDLDNFKQVNDSLGHSMGDDALRLYCSIVKRILGPVGEVYRRGGDEVVAFAPGLDGLRARALAEDVRVAVENELRSWANEHELTVSPTASIGVVVPDGVRGVEEIVRMMDDAQHQAKQAGKNRVVFLE